MNECVCVFTCTSMTCCPKQSTRLLVFHFILYCRRAYQTQLNCADSRCQKKRILTLRDLATHTQRHLDSENDADDEAHDECMTLQQMVCANSVVTPVTTFVCKSLVDSIQAVVFCRFVHSYLTYTPYLPDCTISTNTPAHCCILHRSGFSDTLK